MDKTTAMNGGQCPPPYSPSYSPYYTNNDHAGPAPIPNFNQQGNNMEMPSGTVLPEYIQGLEDVNQFSEASIRRGFIRKVYLTLLLQLVLTVGIICAFLYWETLKKWTMQTIWFPYSMMAITIVLVIVMSCCADVRRKVPLNFIFLGVFTAVEGLVLGSITVYFNADAVLWAVGATALVSFALSVFAMQSKFDFTVAYGCAWVFVWTLISFGILCAILRSQYLYIIYASLGTLLFSFYLVMDTQLMLGGKHKYSISPEEYIFAALNLYLDIISIFLMILHLIGLSR